MCHYWYKNIPLLNKRIATLAEALNGAKLNVLSYNLLPKIKVMTDNHAKCVLKCGYYFKIHDAVT